MLEMMFFLLFLYALSKWISWKVSFYAVLLYYAESGVDLPESTMIKKYAEKAIKKLLRIKEV